MEKNRYYFTMGYTGHVYEGGWVEIVADTLLEAQVKFKKRFGSEAYNSAGLLRYCCPYTLKELQETRMDVEGNFGAFCHEVIE